MGGRGAKSSSGKGKKVKKGGGGIVSNNETLPQSTENKLSPLQIKLKKKLFSSYKEKREQWNRVGSNRTINYDKSDKRITRTQGEGHVTRASRWRKEIYFKDFKTNNKSAVHIQNGKIKKRWGKHFNEHHNARLDRLNSAFMNAQRITAR